MNMNEAKKDFAARLNAAGVTFEKIVGKTIGLADLARTSSIYLEVNGATFREGTGPKDLGCPKPSDGGYIATCGDGCKWVDPIHARLEYLRGEIEAECISMEEIAELQDLAANGHVPPDDILLLQWAGVPENHN